MILPIVVYGDPVLLKKTENITPEYPNLKTLIKDMFDTMYNASGVGLAAPQIGLPINLFIVDASPFEDEKDEDIELIRNFKKVFINAEILEESGEKWAFKEGCLSIPDINEDVSRYRNIKIKYQDENFVEHIEDYTGIIARIIQHEYDHILGKLFTDYLSSLRKTMLKKRFEAISTGMIKEKYKMRFPNQKRGKR